MEEGFDIADFLQRFSSKVLWHFTGYDKTDLVSFNILNKIVTQQILKVTEHPENIIMPGGEKRWCFPYSCMCDIPFKDLRVHTLRYGGFGIAFNKNKAITRGHFNPVLYIHKDMFMFKHASLILPAIDKLAKDHKELKDKMTQLLGLLGSYTKRTDLTAKLDITNKVLDKEQNNNFYYEREWRSLYNWKFDKADIAAVMVPKRFFNQMQEIASTFKDLPVITYEMVEIL